MRLTFAPLIFKLYLSSVEAYEAPLAAYVNETPNFLLLPQRAQAEKVKSDMTLAEIISLLGRPQRYIDETNVCAFQWDLAFNKNLTVTFVETKGEVLKSWAKRMKSQNVTLALDNTVCTLAEVSKA